MAYDYAHHLITTRLNRALVRDVAVAADQLYGLSVASMERYLAHVAMRNALRAAFRSGAHLVDVAEAAGLPTHQLRDDRPTFNVWHGPLRQAIEPGVPGRVA